jgi:hypothetical protein
MTLLEYLEIDIDTLRQALESAPKLDDESAVFEQLSLVARSKSLINDALEQVERIEQLAKQIINSKAKELYGRDWVVIKGDGYKINRVLGGAVYEINGIPKKDFIVVKESPDTKKIEIYREINSKLPDGISLNEHRSESIRIKVNE